MAVLRTPDERFQDLPDFPYQPHYIQHGSLRVAYIDEQTGENPSETFLCLHGQPTWSYLYRRMIPELLHYTTRPGNRGSSPPPSRRVIAPDLLGFGRSDKPTLDAEYTFTFHRATLLHLITTLNLTNLTLVVQDWGGLLGLTLPPAMPTRFSRLLVMNTVLATGTPPGPGFAAWRAYSNKNPDLNVGALMQRGCPHLSPAERAAYDAPFPDARYKAGVRRFPNLVMTAPGMEGVEVSRASVEFYRGTDQFKAEDVFVACGMRDVVLGPEVMGPLARMWRGGCYYAEIGEAGHFVQEWGVKVARLAIGVFEGGAAGAGRVDGVRKVEPVSGGGGGGQSRL